LALLALHGIEEAITHMYPEARVIAYADDCLGLHPDRAVLVHSQQLLSEWLAGIGLTLNTSKTRISHTLEGDQPGMDFLGFHIRQYRVGKHQSGKSPRGAQRLGYKTLITPAKANVKDHLAELGRIIRQGQNGPQAAFIRKLNPKIRGWANYYRTWVSQATFSRLDYLIWGKLRRWAHRRHPHTSATWIHHRYWRRRDSREVFATPVTPDGQVWLTNHSEIPSLFHAKVASNRSPYDGDWVYWSHRRGHYPTVKTRVATLLKKQHGRCAYCGQYFQHDDQLEVDHINGDRRNARYNNLQAFHGHCHDAKPREHGEYLPGGRRDKHQHPEERRDRKRSCSVLKQR
jgi:RNA-directed DNA polymerase